MTDHIPEPTLFLMGCQPWPPLVWTDAPGHCPVCGPGVQPADHHVHCGWCDSSSPAIEARARSARLGVQCRNAAQAREQQARTKLASERPMLTERERRLIWCGYKRTVLADLAGAVPNLAQIGREWLTKINQAPDWSLKLDRRGRVVGRVVG